MLSFAFIGPYGVGKTSLANALVEHRGYTRLPFADAVKQDCAYMLDAILAREVALGEIPNPAVIDKTTIEQFKKTTFGPLLQWYGTDFWREFMQEPNHWIDRWRREYSLLSGPVVVDDCRFVNEAEALIQYNFMLIRLVRDTNDAGSDVRATTHASETEQVRITTHNTIDLTGMTIQEAQDYVLSYCDRVSQQENEHGRLQTQETIKFVRP